MSLIVGQYYRGDPKQKPKQWGSFSTVQSNLKDRIAQIDIIWGSVVLALPCWSHGDQYNYAIGDISTNNNVDFTNNYLSFIEASSNYIHFASVPDISNANISIVIQATDFFPDSWQAFFQMGTAAGSRWGLWANTNKLVAVCNGYTTQTNDSLYSDTKQIAYVHRYLNTEDLYVDGDLSESLSFLPGPTIASSDATIGKTNFATAYPSTMHLYNILLVYDELTADQISFLYDNPFYLWQPPTFRTYFDLSDTTVTNLLDSKLIIKNSAINLLDGKIKVGSISSKLLDGLLQVQNQDIDLLDSKIKLKDAATNLLDGKATIKNTGADLLDGSLVVSNISTNILDSKIIIKSIAVNLLDSKLRIKDSISKLFDSKVVLKDVISSLFDSKIIIKESLINLLDSKLIIESGIDVTNLLDGKIIVESVGVAQDFLDSKIIVKDVATNFLDGLIIIKNQDTDALDNKLIIKNTSTLNLDSKITIKDIASDLLDSKINIQSKALELLDGKLNITSAGISLLDGRIVVKDDSTILLDGKISVETGQVLEVFDGKITLTELAQGKVKVYFSASTPSISFSII